MCPGLFIVLSTVFVLAIHAFPPEGYGPIGQRRCFQPVRIEIPECQNTFYNFTGLPNLVGQESQADARHQLQTFKPLITYKCSNQLAFFLCSVYSPMCDVNTHHLIGPCRPLCERVRKRCSPVLRIFDFDWPANLNCSRFPERNTVGGAMCMEGPEAADDEEDEDTSTVDSSAHKPAEGDVGKTEWSWPASSQKASATSSQSVRGEINEERGIIPAEGIIRQIEDLPEAANIDLSKLGPQLQNWLARLSQNPLSTFFGNNEIPVALLVSSLRFCSHFHKPTSYIFINRTGRCAPHCTADILFSQNAKTLATVWTSVISGLCLLATTCTLLSYAIQPSLFHPLERPVIYIAGCQLVYALGFALRLKLGREAVACGVDPASGYSIRLQEGLENSNCALVFLVQYYFFIAGAIWWAMMVIGWTRRTTYIYRLMLNPCRDSSSAYVPLRSPCCCLTRSGRSDTPFVNEETGAFIEGESGGEVARQHCSSSGVNPVTVGPNGGAQPAATSSLRVSQVNRRIQTASSNSIDLNCLAKEHVVAWLTPGLLTVAVLVTRQVDADELLGICSVGRQNTRTMLIFMLVPQFLFLLLGLIAFVVCALYLHKLGKLTDRKRCDGLAPSATMSHLDAPPARCLAFQPDHQQGYLDPSYEGVSTSEASSYACFSGQACCCCRRALRWDGVSTRLGFFTLLYVVPAISILACDFYEFLFRDAWLAGDPSTAVSNLLQSHVQRRGKITPEIFLLRTFMSLVTGLATCLWLLSIKGIEPWRQLARQIESRCARSGYFCFSTLGLKTPATTAAGAAARPLPDPNNQAYSKTKEQHQTDPCSPHNPSTSSTVLHPYAVYQHRCSSGKSDGLMTHCDNKERYQAQVPLASRPPAGPGLDAGDQFFLSPQAGTMASGGTLTSVSSPTQASGYYSSATNNSGATRGNRPSPAPCPPPNTPPLPPFGGRSDPKVPHGSVASNSQYPDWWGSNGVKNFNGPQNRHAIL